mmetsp:Transcript_2305/g.5506  ORF Transcript_2305/g.5506 Transcript_2305/m.5506 type:complete len:319 (+) Transcript_2305:28-984(+)
MPSCVSPYDEAVTGFTGMDMGNPHTVCAVVCLAVAAVCFVVGTITGNVSQVDKLWSIVPVVYTAIPLVFNPMDPRLQLMTLLATLWGVRLTYNFWRRGGYTWPPWSGEEDYRWPLLRSGKIPAFKILTNKYVWVVFNLTFISLYQNLLLFMIASPALGAWVATKCPEGAPPLGLMDAALAAVFLALLTLETVADNTQYRFQEEKYRQINSGTPREKLPGEYAVGFCRSGVFAWSRHPNYFAEQALWCTFYWFSYVANPGGCPFNWTLAGCLMLIITIFGPSTWLTESITKGKYPAYAEYQANVNMFIPSPPMTRTKVS